MAILKIDLHEYAEKVAEITLDEMQYKGKTLRQWADGITNPKNNADRIRSMSDEELARFLDNTDGDSPPNVERCSIEESEGYWLDWLRQECE